ncbi:MAG TPA: 30S ribosomal protein S9 [Rickettsiales bacterium]|nr:30S ribosomal protein S9 [Rickettsiales bacterium]
MAKKTLAPKKEVSTVEKKAPVKVVHEEKVAKPKVKKATTNVTYATGKRKNAIAKVWLSSGTGKITINNQPATEYLKRAILDVVINQPFGKTETLEKFDVNCTVLGGGLSGQAGAIKHAISIALQLLNSSLRDPLKKAGFLTRDSRVVERKKAGLKKARKGQVFQKR